jgi:hypothetical protein
MISGGITPVSNRETFTLQIELYDEEAEELIDVSDVTEVVIEITPRPVSSFTRTSSLSARLSASEITQPELGIFECIFSSTQMKTLCAGTHDIGGTLTKDGETVQFMIGTLPVLDGIVSR